MNEQIFFFFNIENDGSGYYTQLANFFVPEPADG